MNKPGFYILPVRNIGGSTRDICRKGIPDMYSVYLWQTFGYTLHSDHKTHQDALVAATALCLEHGMPMFDQTTEDQRT